LSLLEDRNISTVLQSQAEAIAGVSVTHDVNNDSGKIIINGAISLCDLYDYIKANKMTNLEEPNFESMLVEVVEDTLFTGQYQLEFQPGGILKPCDKFKRIVTETATIFDDVNTNLEVSLKDINQNYKLIRLLGVESSNVKVTDNITSTELFSEPNLSGEVSIVTLSTSNDVTTLVTKSGFNNWAVDTDLTTGDVFEYPVYNSEIVGNPCTLSNQELELYLLRKILAKSENISSTLSSDASIDVILNQITVNGTNDCLLEKQEEMLFLLRKIAAKSERIISHLNN